MNIVIPPVPDRYNIVNLHGTDLAEANGHKVIGLYDAISDALDEDKIEMFYNWRFADIIIPPAYVMVDDSTLGEFVINEEIRVASDDTISIIGVSRPPIINSLTVTANGTYAAPLGVDGFSPVIVEVPETPPPILVSLRATQNGHYLPGANEDGFSEVTVNVPEPVLVSLNASENGVYTPTSGQDGFSEVTVNLPIPQPYDSNPARDGVASPGVSSQWARGDHVHPATIVLDNSDTSVYGGVKFKDENGNTKLHMYVGKLDSTRNYVQFEVNGLDRGYIIFSVSRNVGQ